MKLRIYEIESTSTWWVASNDELGVLSIIRDEMYSRDFSDSEVDAMLDEVAIEELDRSEAEAIGVTDIDGEIRSLWYCFITNKREGVLGTSLDDEPVDMAGVDELNFDDDY